MRGQINITSTNKRLTLILGFMAAAIVACTSVFQFSLSPVASVVEEVSVSQVNEEAGYLSFESSDKADNSTESQKTVCKIQAVSQGVQLHVTYSPIIWESFDIEIPELKVEIPKQLYKAGWEYFRVLFTDIIAPNAP